MRAQIMRVRTDSAPQKVAGAILYEVREGSDVQLHAIGAGAVNQALKAVAIARGFAAPQGMDLVCIPGFFDIENNGEPRTAMKLIIKSF